MLDHQEAYEAIAYAPGTQIRELADLTLQDSRVEVRRQPEPALLMLRAQETVEGEVFNLGEVLVTRCEVALDGEPGWAMVMGEDRERALCAAILDAAVRAGGREWLDQELSLQLAFAREDRRLRWQRVQPTRVEFEELA